MIFNSQGDAKLRQYINGQTITPGDTAITLPKGAQLLGDVTLAAVQTETAEVTPTAEQQIIFPPTGHYYNKLIIEAAECGEMQYAWRKVKTKEISVSNPQIQLVNNGLNVEATSLTTGLNLKLVDEKFFDGFYLTIGSNYRFVYVQNDGLYYYINSTPYKLSYIPEKQTLVGTINLGFNHVAQYIGNKNCIGLNTDLKSYFASNDPNAYPTGIYDGFFYEKIE